MFLYGFRGAPTSIAYKEPLHQTRSNSMEKVTTGPLPVTFSKTKFIVDLKFNLVCKFHLNLKSCFSTSHYIVFVLMI